ncbi:uncharacterized protein C8Q71DRAFT_854389 [Rhodofomes roseus]|uniref:Uncharacterized protein n=1 Tax=Rhodofomes roseus TaxID=34475 RepID=A0ABQ8KTC2_9APHY|nr:uncharacterized protein C8Q71DRAFT_854389 [Rhodofomes roseus]KAH9842034.1 hypothetical protein C8Q71DRAFT_854389 [Rhodofomes roseus]
MNRASQIGTGTPGLICAIGTTPAAAIRPIYATSLNTTAPGSYLPPSLPSMAPNNEPSSHELRQRRLDDHELRQRRLDDLNRIPRATLNERFIETEDRLSQKETDVIEVKNHLRAKEVECLHLFHIVVQLSQQSRKLGLTGALSASE